MSLEQRLQALEKELHVNGAARHVAPPVVFYDVSFDADEGKPGITLKWQEQLAEHERSSQDLMAHVECSCGKTGCPEMTGQVIFLPKKDRR